MNTVVHYCVQCGAPTHLEERYGRLRPVCSNCGWIYFTDPKVAAAVLVEKDDEVLLVRRINEPERHKWSIPAGFIDAGEDPARAAERECLEETGLHVHVTTLLDVVAGKEFPNGADIVIIYQGEIVSGEVAAGDDAEDAAFFSRDALPPLAFQTTQKLLEEKP